MSQENCVLANQDGQEFRWPPSSYGRLLGASAVGQRMHPPFVGSAATRCEDSENGHNFPSLIASDVIEGNAKIAAGDAPTNRRVHFSDVAVPRGLRFRSNPPKIVAKPCYAKNVEKSTKAIKAQYRSDEKKTNGFNDARTSPLIKSKSIVSIRTRPQFAVVKSEIEKKPGVRVSSPKEKMFNVNMNKAAVMRQNHIRNRLRAEWYKYEGGEMKPCPFE